VLKHGVSLSKFDEMCKICKKAINGWFHRMVMGETNIPLINVQKSCERAFGRGVFKTLYLNRNRDIKLACQHCGEIYIG